MGKKQRLTFFTAGESVFLNDIIISLRKDYEVKMFFRGKPEEFHTMLHDTDIAWFEWCDELTAHATVQPKMCKYICRLHSYEMFTDWPKKVDWNKMDKLIFVNPIVRDYSIRKFGIRPDITDIICNGVNMDKFQMPKNKKYNKKVVYIGYINYKKGPELLLQAFKAIYDYDNEFEFHIAGEHQDERIKLYFDTMIPKLPFKIHFDGWVQDMPVYLEDKDYVISSSLFESFQYSIGEGMAQGLVPLVHSWIGSDYFYPTDYIWTFPNECVDIVKRFEEQEDKQAIRNGFRNHIGNNFSLEKQLSATKDMIGSL